VFDTGRLFGVAVTYMSSETPRIFSKKFDTVKHEIRIRNAYDVYALETL